MPTRFGRFISGNFFQKLFLVLYVISMCFVVWETEHALGLLAGRTHSYGIVYALFALAAVLVLFKKQIFAKYKNTFLKKLISFLSCFILYDLLFLLVWRLISLAPAVTAQIHAVGVLAVFWLSWGVVLAGYLYTKHIAVKKYDLELGTAGNTYRIATVSDIHLGIFVGPKHIRKIVRKINSLCPDAVAIPGDIFDVDNSLLSDPEKLKRIAKEFRRIQSREGVYAVVGNHDPKINNDTFQKFLKMARIRLLNDEVKELSLVQLVGRTDPAANARTSPEAVFQNTAAGKPVVVLEHRPENMEEAAAQKADLVLSGHTHRGQMFPINLFTRWANGKGRFYGYSRFGQTHCIVSSGVGFFELPIRLGTSNEIVDVRLQL